MVLSVDFIWVKCREKVAWGATVQCRGLAAAVAASTGRGAGCAAQTGLAAAVVVLTGRGAGCAVQTGLAVAGLHRLAVPSTSAWGRNFRLLHLLSLQLTWAKTLVQPFKYLLFF